MPTSRAAVFERVGEIELQSIAIPQPIGDERLVRVLGCTLCASDLHSFQGRRSVPCPTVLGHEIVGEIVQFGPEAQRFDWSGRPLSIGDRVSWAVVASCGQCIYCRNGLPQKCTRSTKYGHEAFKPGRELVGGLAEHCLLVSGTHVMRWPDQVPLAVACPASCATATAMASLDAIGELRGLRLLVLGAGMLGLTTCAIASARGAAEIMCVDPIDQRRQQALRFGATCVADPAQAAALVAERTEGYGADAVIEMSGVTAAFDTAWQCIRMGGTLVLVGSVFPSPPVPVALEHVVRRCLRIQGVHNYGPQHLSAAVEFLSAHHAQFPFESLVSQWFRLDEISQALAAAAQPGVVRIGVTC
ncbi:MAG: zinc-binding dehydrogenase [Pirellulaceae bacterium]|nr:zinc-binding dehydrogenase [Pirellulaceae bacterium]